MLPELTEGQDFGEFLQGAEAARQDEKRVCQGLHTGFSLPHVARDDELIRCCERDRFGCQTLGHDTDDAAPAILGRVRQCAHKADVAAAVNQRIATPGDVMPQDSAASKKTGATALLDEQ